MSGIGWAQIADLIDRGVNTTFNGIGLANKLSHSHSQKATWGDMMKAGAVNEYYADRAEQRALSNAKDLFSFQQVMGPQLTMSGYKGAGINPILVGDYNGSMPSFGTSSISTSPSISPKVDKAAAFRAFAETQAGLAESASRTSLNETSAAATAERSRQDQALFNDKQTLLRAQAAKEAELPAYYRKQIDKLEADILMAGVKRDYLNSQIDTNAAEVSYRENMLKLAKLRLEEDIRYHKDQVEGLNKSYIGLPYNMGRLYLGGIFGDDSKVGKFFERDLVIPDDIGISNAGDIWRINNAIRQDRLEKQGKK